MSRRPPVTSRTRGRWPSRAWRPVAPPRRGGPRARGPRRGRSRASVCAATPPARARRTRRGACRTGSPRRTRAVCGGRVAPWRRRGASRRHPCRGRPPAPRGAPRPRSRTGQGVPREPWPPRWRRPTSPCDFRRPSKRVKTPTNALGRDDCTRMMRLAVAAQPSSARHGHRARPHEGHEARGGLRPQVERPQR